MDCFVTRAPNCSLMPASYDDQEKIREHFKDGQAVRVKLTKTRNLAFHRKWFALANFAFDYWEPPILPPDPEVKWQRKVRPQKNFDRFRKDLTILAGFYDSFYRLDGSIRIEAKSIAFASMDEDDFAELYSKTIDIIIQKITPQYDAETVRGIVDQVLAFT